MIFSRLFIFSCAVMLTMFAGCGDSSSSSTGGNSEDENLDRDDPKDSTSIEDTVLSNVTLSGYSQKGPFVVGSSVTAFELNNGTELRQTGNSFNGIITNDDGFFNVKTVKLASQYASLVVDGYYRNEVSGENSSSPITLRALVDLSKKSSANINVLTHLEYDRVIYYVTEKGKSFDEAKKLALKDLLAIFDITDDVEGSSEDFSINGDGKMDAVLLAISILLQADRTEGEMLSLITRIGSDYAEDGVWDESEERIRMITWIYDNADRLDEIVQNLKTWEMYKESVPDFQKVFRQIIATELDLGPCDEENVGKVVTPEFKPSHKNIIDSDDYYACRDDGTWWRLNGEESNEYLLPKDTVEGAIIRGPIEYSIFYVFENGQWHKASEEDQLMFRLTENDNFEIKDVVYWDVPTERYWVYVDSVWREASTLEQAVGYGCSNRHQGESSPAGVNAENYATCDGKEWKEVDFDTFALGNCNAGLVPIQEFVVYENDPASVIPKRKNVSCKAGKWLVVQ